MLRTHSAMITMAPNATKIVIVSLLSAPKFASRCTGVLTLISIPAVRIASAIGTMGATIEPHPPDRLHQPLGVDPGRHQGTPDQVEQQLALEEHQLDRLVHQHADCGTRCVDQNEGEPGERQRPDPTDPTGEEVGADRSDDDHVGWAEVLTTELRAKQPDRHVCAAAGDDRLDQEDHGQDDEDGVASVVDLEQVEPGEQPEQHDAADE